ncbi:hypothetical protein GE253_16350 [Niveispirillum sp. SYP-B3756]|uniref:TldD/PmbA family protein n=1 Tax=Niveispirillum sp. SYP-B3756 TaxID=2662178 RepID=UPI001291E074|nr:metallopeptidase TldD-related protein [Niveispirillum sp. SYP-B3756]MQP66906.1 hypothetical protein [Niveispirillum sp. SYP-B3756]
MINLRLNEERLRALASLAVDQALALGDVAVSATARIGGGMRFTVAQGTADKALRDLTQSVVVTVYQQGRMGTASTSSLEETAIRRAAAEAVATSGRVAVDPDAGLADPATLAHDTPLPELASPSGLSVAELSALAFEMDAAACGCAILPGIATRVAEAGVASSDGRVALATSAGFCRSFSFSNHGLWAMVKAEKDGQSAIDVAQSTERRFQSLDSVEMVAQKAVERAVAQLGARSLATQRASILFDARIASALLGDVVGALGGVAQFRRTSLFQDSLGTQIAPDHIDLLEDPFLPFGLASGAYDREGVAGQQRAVIEAGVVRGYFLDSRAARRLSMRSTGNADGPWNLRFISRAPAGDRAALCARMGRGLLVTQFNGGATDPVTGNWTRAAGGFWVEDGVPTFPVSGITVGGNLRDMIGGIVTIGSDLYRQGAFQTGSILIHDLQIGGAP